MRIVYAGTPEFALPSLSRLYQEGFAIPAVLTQPDRPAGRGQKLKAPPVKQWAQSQGLAVYQPQSLKAASIQNFLTEIAPDAIVVVAYGLYFPEQLLGLPSLGCINLHPSLLPRWRGAAPIQHAIWHGDDKTGVTTMLMGEGLDNGDLLMQRQCDIDHYTAGQLHDRLADMGGELILETLNGLADGAVSATPQQERFATYAPKITKEQARINWRTSAYQIERMVRALNPAPVAYSYLHGSSLRLWQVEAISEQPSSSPGVIEQVTRDAVVVAASQGCVVLKQIQRPGKQPLEVRQWLNSERPSTGDRFD